MIILLSVSTHKLLGKDGKEGMLNRGVDIDGTVSKDDAVISSGALLAFPSRRALGSVGFKFETCLGLVRAPQGARAYP